MEGLKILRLMEDRAMIYWFDGGQGTGAHMAGKMGIRQKGAGLKYGEVEYSNT